MSVLAQEKIFSCSGGRSRLWLAFRKASKECGDRWATIQPIHQFGICIDHIFDSSAFLCHSTWVRWNLGSNVLFLTDLVVSSG
jgi:hypothetical protein